MHIRTIVTIVAAGLLSVGLVSVSSAQDGRGIAQDGIEVITIIGKRPEPAVATACAGAGIKTTGAGAEQHDGDSNSTARGLDASGSNTNVSRPGTKRCTGQAATLDVHI